MSNQDRDFVERFSPWMSRTIKIKQVIYSGQTSFQHVDVVDTYDYGVTLFLDNCFQTSERDEFFYHESLVHPAMVTHPAPKKILIVGGGDGGTLEEVCRYSCVESIDMVELDREVVEICRKYLKKVSGDAFDDPRLNLTIGDGRAFIEKSDSLYDVIILDLIDPLEPSKYVYTKEFYIHCANHLREQGILALHNDSPFFYPEAFNVITKTIDSVFPYKSQYLTFIPGYMLDFAFSFCSNHSLPTLTQDQIEERLAQRKVGKLLYYAPATHPSDAPLPGYMRQILETPCDISTDERPYVMDADL